MVGVDSILELFSTYLKQCKFQFNYSSTLENCGSIIQNNSGRLFHIISFLQLLFILLKFYFFFKNKIYGQNIVRLS
jgi:hypothetical protein